MLCGFVIIVDIKYCIKKLLTNRLWYDIIRLSNEGVDCMEFKRLNSKEYYCVVCGQFGRL